MSNNTELKPGVVVWVETPRSDGKGFKVHPAIVIEDDGELLHVVAGSSQKATEGALLSGEFLVTAWKEREVMGLTKESVRFAVNRGNYVWVSKSLVKYVIGAAPESVIGRMFKAGREVNAW
jgi:hypothetical protein